jgi:hypothetical protein
MSAYSATVSKLVGPLFLLLFSVAWTGIIRQLQPKLQQRNFDFSATYSGTLAATVLFVFSSVSSDRIFCSVFLQQQQDNARDELSQIGLVEQPPVDDGIFFEVSDSSLKTCPDSCFSDP